MRPRAAAMRPTRRSTRSCRPASSCRGPPTMSRPRSRSAREMGIPLLSRGGGTSQCGQTTGAALVIDHSKYLRRVLAVDAAGDARRSRARPGARPPERRAEAARPVVSGRCLDQRTGHAGRHGRQQLVRLAQHRLRQHGAQRRRHRRLAGRWQRWCRFGPVDGLGPRERGIADFVRTAGRTASQRDRCATGRRCCAASAGYNLDIFHPQSDQAVYRRRQRQPGAPAGRQRRNAGDHRAAAAEAEPAAARARCWASSTIQSFRAAMDSAQHIVKLGPERGRAGRPHDDRAGARQPGLPAGDREGADRRTGGDPAGRVQRRRARAAAAPAAGSWSN